MASLNPVLHASQNVPASQQGRARPWHWLTMLSFDAPLVAATWQRAAAREWEVSLPWSQTFLLLAVVWLIYAADRWFEAARVPPDALALRRHAFYSRHLQAFAVAMVLVAGGATFFTLRLVPIWEMTQGVVVMAACSLYVLSHQGWHRQARFRVPKEVCVALLFSAGTFLAPVSAFTHTAESLRETMPLVAFNVLAFAALCFLNLCLISIVEKEADRLQGQSSLATTGPGLAHRLPWLSALLAFGILALFLTTALVSLRQTASLLAGILFLELLRRLRSRLHRETLRTLADVALLTPVLFAWL